MGAGFLFLLIHLSRNSFYVARRSQKMIWLQLRFSLPPPGEYHETKNKGEEYADRVDADIGYSSLPTRDKELVDFVGERERKRNQHHSRRRHMGTLREKISKHPKEQYAQNKVFNDMSALSKQELPQRERRRSRSECRLRRKEEDHAHPHQDENDEVPPYFHIPKPLCQKISAHTHRKDRGRIFITFSVPPVAPSRALREQRTGATTTTSSSKICRGIDS